VLHAEGAGVVERPVADQATPDDPQKTRAPTVEACLTISNWLCSPSATMYSAMSWPPEIFLAIAWITVS
jgi:hypothetical protein